MPSGAAPLTEAPENLNPAARKVSYLLALRFLSGPLCFFLLYFLAFQQLHPGGRVALATLGWAVAWWVLEPVPWAVTAVLPLAIFPLTQTVPFGETAQLYGQPIFFFLMSISLLAYAILKYGVAKRFALFFLSLPGVASSTYRLLFVYMLATGFVSWFLSDASTIALMMPLGLSLQAHIRSLAPARSQALEAAAAAESNPAALSAVEAAVPERPRGHPATLFALGTLYAAVAGGTATLAGMPHNAVAAAQLETLTGRTIGWFSWMMVGVPIFATTLVLFFLLLVWLYRPPIGRISGTAEFIRAERAKLGRITRGEINVLVTFCVAAAVFTVPAVLSGLLGRSHPVSEWLSRTVSFWLVSPIILVLLFALPINAQNREFVLNWQEGAAKTPWHILIMVTSAVGMTDALAKFGFMEMLTSELQGLKVEGASLLFLAGLMTAASTNFISGIAATSIYTGILIPVAQEIGFSPAAIAIVVPCTAVGIITPWAGATVATAFGFGEISIRDLARAGVLAEAIMICVAATYCLLFAPVL